MMSVDIDALVASSRWEWREGMLTKCGMRIIDGGREYIIGYRWGSTSMGGGMYDGPVWSGILADIDDPATQGCLLALVRKAYGHGPTRDVNIERVDDGRYCLAVLVLDQGIWRYDDAVHDTWDGFHRTRPTVADLARDTYGQALAAALLAAPAPEARP
jgi:hypothetical protein